jgi:putative oxidoreductase
MADNLESMGLRPGKPWASTAGLSEFGGGMLTVLGLFNPLGSIAIISSMAMATLKVHAGKPIWVAKGGAELPVTNIAIALALAVTGPGRYSLDHAFGLKVHPMLVGLVGAAAAAGIFFGLSTEEPSPLPQVTQRPEPIESAGGV